MFKYYSIYNYFGSAEVAKDIFRFCVDNPQNLDFDPELDIHYEEYNFGLGHISVCVEIRDRQALKDFVLVAELVRGIENG